MTLMNFIFVAIATFSVGSYAADLAIPDATKKKEPFAKSAEATTASVSAPLPGLTRELTIYKPQAPNLNLPGPMATNLPAPSAPGPYGLNALGSMAVEAEDNLGIKSVATQLQNWQVAAVLDDTVVLRAPAGNQGLQALTLTAGEKQPFLYGVDLTAKLNGSAVHVTASLGKLNRVVFVGQIQNRFPDNPTNTAQSQLVGPPAPTQPIR